MKNRVFGIIVILLVFCLLGCVPTKRVIWSPDGARALFQVSESGEGRVFVLEGEELKPRDLGIQGVPIDWLPDGRRAVVATFRVLGGTDAHVYGLDMLLVDTMATDIRSVTEAVLASTVVGEKDEKDWQAITTGSVDPTGRLLAIPLFRKDQALSDTQPGYDLMLCELGHPGPWRVIDSSVGQRVAWSPDGRQLAYFRYKGTPQREEAEEPIRLGSLVTLDVKYTDDGHLVSNLGSQERVGVIFQTFAGLQFAPDGSLLFAGFEIHLPATLDDMSKTWSVFRWDPKYPRVVNRVLNREDSLWFDGGHESVWDVSISPDGRCLLLFGNEKIYIYSVQSGKGSIVSDVHTDERGTLPAWRNESEFTILVKPGHVYGSSRRSELVLVRVNERGEIASSRCLSKDWPDELVKDWFEWAESENK